HTSYEVPVTLAGNASTTLSLLELINAQQPDVDGNQLPIDVREGSAAIAGTKGPGQSINVSISVGTFNALTGTCVYQQCNSCDGFTNFSYLDNPFAMPVGNNQQTRDYLTWNNATTTTQTTFTLWSS